MTRQVVRRPHFRLKLLLIAAACVAVVAPIVFCQVKASQTDTQSSPAATGSLPSFDAASVKPNRSDQRGGGMRMNPGRFTARNIPPIDLIEYAYHLRDMQLSGASNWVKSERFDIEATINETPYQIQKLNQCKSNPAGHGIKKGEIVCLNLVESRAQQLRLMLQSLLADRFKLVVSRETRELPVYALIVAKNGPKLHKITDRDAPPFLQSGNAAGRPWLIWGGRGRITASAVSLGEWAEMLSQLVDRVVLDKTGLQGFYSFTLRWGLGVSEQQMSSEREGGGMPPGQETPSLDESGPSIFSALQDQLGLKLESEKGPVEIVVIQHIEQPSAN